MKIGTCLKIWRIRRGITQNELSNLINFSREYISDIERGKNIGSMHFWFTAKIALAVSDDEFSELCKERAFIEYEKKSKKNKICGTESAG